MYLHATAVHFEEIGPVEHAGGEFNDGPAGSEREEKKGTFFAATPENDGNDALDFSIWNRWKRADDRSPRHEPARGVWDRKGAQQAAEAAIQDGLRSKFGSVMSPGIFEGNGRDGEWPPHPPRLGCALVGNGKEAGSAGIEDNFVRLLDGLLEVPGGAQDQGDAVSGILDAAPGTH